MIRLDKSSPVGVSKHLDPVIAHALTIEKTMAGNTNTRIAEIKAAHSKLHIIASTKLAY